MKTSHGYHIPGTMEDEHENKKSPHRCGGPNNDCKTCTQDIATYRMREALVETASLRVKAERLVAEYVVGRFSEMNLDLKEFEVHTLLFHKDKLTQDWTIFLGTSIDDNYIYNVSYKHSSELTRVAVYGLSDEEFIADL